MRDDVGTLRHINSVLRDIRNRHLIEAGSGRGNFPGYRLKLARDVSEKLVEATGKSYEIYDGAIKDANEAITIVLAGQTVTTEGTAGFSSGNIHDAIKQDLIRFDAQRLSGTLREQSLEP